MKVRDGFMPFVDVLHRVELPPRGIRGCRANKKRKLLVSAALHQEKVRRSGGQCKKRKGGRCRLCRVGVPLRKAEVL